MIKEENNWDVFIYTKVDETGCQPFYAAFQTWAPLLPVKVFFPFPFVLTTLFVCSVRKKAYRTRKKRQQQKSMRHFAYEIFSLLQITFHHQQWVVNCFRIVKRISMMAERQKKNSVVTITDACECWKVSGWTHFPNYYHTTRFCGEVLLRCAEIFFQHQIVFAKVVLVYGYMGNIQRIFKMISASQSWNSGFWPSLGTELKPVGHI